MATGYLETNDEKLALQIDNFASKIPEYATMFGLTVAEISSIQADAKAVLWTVNQFEKINSFKKNWTAYKKILVKGEINVSVNLAPTMPVLEPAPAAVAAGVLNRFSTLVNRVKAHGNYTTAIGANLGVHSNKSGTKATVDAAKPTLKAVLRGGKVHLVWNKKTFTGIVIEKSTGAGFVFLDKDYSPNFVDNSPMPTSGESAVWQYRASYLQADEKVGLTSDIVSITVAG